MPPLVETEHFLISGKTGAGKTQAIEAMLRRVRERPNPALIADPAGGYFSRFGQTDDIILNPFDARDAGWSPFAEIRHDYDCERIAHATIPSGEGDSREWHFYAQSLLAETLRALHARNQHSVRELLRIVMQADRDELAEFFLDTPAGVLCHKGNEKMLSNTRSITALYLNAWTYLKDDGTFSIRNWVRAHQGRWLFITYRDDQAALLRLWIATLIDLAIIEGLTLEENPEYRIWYVMDELDSLGCIPSLQAGVTKLRKYGGAVIAGIQTIAQLRSTYGFEQAQTILSCLSTKLILAAGDSETAHYFEKELGQQEVERLDTSNSETTQGMFSGTTSESVNHRYERKLQSTVLASQIQGLAPLTGFLKHSGEAIYFITMPYQKMERIQENFVAMS